MQNQTSQPGQPLTQADFNSFDQANGIAPAQNSGSGFSFTPYQAPTNPENNIVGSTIANTIKNTASDYANAIPNFMKAADSSTIKTNPGSGLSDVIPETGKLLENAGAATASGIMSIFSPFAEGVKSLSNAVANSDTGHAIEQNPIVGKILDIFGGGSKAMNDWTTAHPDEASGLNSALTIALTAAGGGENGLDKPIGTLEGINNTAGKVIDTASEIPGKISDTANALKEKISPSLTPEEQVGQIIQGKISDIPAAQRTFDALPSDTPPVAKMSPADLSETIQNHIQSNLDQVDAHYANDNTPHPMSDFDTTTGTGKNAVTTNYVQQAIDQLKDFYTKTNDAQGLSDIKTLEEKANTEGLTSQELNNLAKEHGSELPKAFSKTGEPLTGANKQATENTRMGLKTTARNMLSQSDPEAAAEVTRLDKNTSDAIKTKNLVDKQVEAENKGVQKNGKPNAVTKTVKQWAKNNPNAAKIAKVGLPLIGAGIIGHQL